MKKKPSFCIKYACGDCGAYHDSIRDAIDCCIREPETPERVDGYSCPDCDEFFDDYDDALSCCGNDEDDLPEYMEETKLGKMKIEMDKQIKKKRKK